MTRFETARLFGQRVVESDRHCLRQLYTDPRVAPWLTTNGEPLTEEQIDQRLAHHLEHWERWGFGLWILRDRITLTFLGYVGLKYAQPDGKDEVELFYGLLPAWWERGLATEAGRAVLEIGAELGLREVICFTLPWNQASRRVMEKLGFQFEKEMTHAGLPHVFYRRSISPTKS